jgi:hypothetical protein
LGSLFGRFAQDFVIFDAVLTNLQKSAKINLASTNEKLADSAAPLNPQAKPRARRGKTSNKNPQNKNL